jgi:hypothetical protein
MKKEAANAGSVNRLVVTCAGAVVAALGALWWMAQVNPPSTAGLEELEVREFVREFAHDLNRGERIETRIHLEHDPRGELDERAHAVTEWLTERSQWKKIRLSVDQLSVSGPKALVLLAVSGESTDAAGHTHPARETALLRLEKHEHGWKVVDVFPRSEGE